MHFRGEGLFERDASALLPRPRRIVQTIADSLHDVLPCYTFGASAAWHENCNPHFAVIEAVQVEGHTDNEGAEIGNLMLSTARANVAFGTMLDQERRLTDHLNTHGQPVLSVAGYGWMRPIATNATTEGRARNRASTCASSCTRQPAPGTSSTSSNGYVARWPRRERYRYDVLRGLGGGAAAIDESPRGGGEPGSGSLARSRRARGAESRINHRAHESTAAG